MITLQQVKNILERVEKLEVYLEIEQKKIEVTNEEEQTHKV